MPATLSKSRFMSGLQCELKLWNDAYRRELATLPTEQQQARFDLGSAVGLLARQRWPGGVLVGYQPWEREPALAETAALTADPSVPAIYEAAFFHANLYIRIDILARTDAGWDLVEVKSATRPEKEVYLQDLAIQDWVLHELGLPVHQAGILVLDRTYVYPGGHHGHDRLFRFHEATEHCQAQLDWVAAEVDRLHGVLALADPPHIPIGDHCFRPHDCPYYAHCSAGIRMPEHPLSDLYRLSQRQRDQLRAAGVETIPDIPADYPLSEIQARILQAVRSGLPWRSADLAIGEGMSAVLEYELALDEPDEPVRQPIFDALRAYCRQDTLAMVQLRQISLS